MELEKLLTGRCVIGVSGGVDSVVLLDLLARQKSLDLIVAHFDHGIRADSQEDAQFVESLAKKHQLLFVSERTELGEDASEEKSRDARYEFLRRTAKQHQAKLILAHHKDDVLETAIINLLRGTGWRGLSSLRSNKITQRPLLNFSKQEILNYAKENKLTWREDASNQDVKYLRNYVRLKLLPHFSQQDKIKLHKLQEQQIGLRGEIELAEEQLLSSWQNGENQYFRYPFIMCNENVALELLKAKLGLTRPQLRLALLAIKTARAGAKHRVNASIVLEFTTSEFIVSRTSDVVS